MQQYKEMCIQNTWVCCCCDEGQSEDLRGLLHFSVDNDEISV